jgi:pyruvate/2-oxoglutarate dehydrogenase complex dihydrolipoamide acyltransferase (E2) component
VARKMMMKLSLCYDSRLLDDAHAERFVQRVRELTENPALLLA